MSTTMAPSVQRQPKLPVPRSPAIDLSGETNPVAAWFAAAPWRRTIANG